MHKRQITSFVVKSGEQGFTLAEVIFSLVLLALFAALAFSLLQSSHLAMFRGNKRAEVNHVTQTAVEHFKASMRVYATPYGGCPDEYAGGQGNFYCHPVTSQYWALYEYGSAVPEIDIPPGGSPTIIGDQLLLVNITVFENESGSFGEEVGTFSFMTFEGGY